jgi:hypothetical protein
MKVLFVITAAVAATLVAVVLWKCAALICFFSLP